MLLFVYFNIYIMFMLQTLLTAFVTVYLNALTFNVFIHMCNFEVICSKPLSVKLIQMHQGTC